MLKKVDAYMLYCDGCGTEFESGDYTLWLHQGDALDAAEGYDWQVHREDGRHLCFDCIDVWLAEDDGV